ncbi:MAG TPA: MarR family transcriptional regulator [Firmicutes bacterium]|nr:MarR family transcriptional regulator [Bacillota bacterium]
MEKKEAAAGGGECPEFSGRRLFSALKGLQRYAMGTHPAMEIRPSEFMMLHSVLRCLSPERACEKPGGRRFDDGLAGKGGKPGVTVSELSAFTHQTPSGASQTIRALEEKGLVRRTTLSSDRRAVYIYPTEEGRALARRAEEAFFSRLESVAEEMGREETEQLICLVGRLTTILERRQAAERGTAPEKAEPSRPPSCRPQPPSSRHSQPERMNEAR